MPLYIMILITLMNDGSLHVRGFDAAYAGADKCLSEKSLMEERFAVAKQAGKLGGYTIECIDAKLRPGRAA